MGTHISIKRKLYSKVGEAIKLGLPMATLGVSSANLITNINRNKKELKYREGQLKTTQDQLKATKDLISSLKKVDSSIQSDINNQAKYRGRYIINKDDPDDRSKSSQNNKSGNRILRVLRILKS